MLLKKFSEFSKIKAKYLFMFGLLNKLRKASQNKMLLSLGTFKISSKLKVRMKEKRLQKLRRTKK